MANLTGQCNYNVNNVTGGEGNTCLNYVTALLVNTSAVNQSLCNVTFEVANITGLSSGLCGVRIDEDEGLDFIYWLKLISLGVGVMILYRIYRRWY